MEKDLDTVFAECYSNLQRSQKGLFFMRESHRKRSAVTGRQ